eukprot:12894830-Prorocentrum_lima.AAC.1
MSMCSPTAAGIPAAVGRSWSLKEALTNPKGKAVLDKEVDRLGSISIWDESVVREWANVFLQRPDGADG